jgi:hypothetical protein
MGREPEGIELFGRYSLMEMEAYGREIAVFAVPPSSDPSGQFYLSVVVDGKERWGAYFTDRSEDA